jgi:hypothetical protein
MDAAPAIIAAPMLANSQPEPMIDVSEAQMAPISPTSRRKPTSAGLAVDTVSVAMIDLFPDRAP